VVNEGRKHKLLLHKLLLLLLLEALEVRATRLLVEAAVEAQARYCRD